MTLSGTNTFGGDTTINANDTLQVGVANTVPSTSDVTDNGTLDLYGNSDAIGALSGSSGGLVTSTANGTPLLTVGATNHSGVFSGVIENGNATSVALTKTGNGTETFSGNNTYTGGSTLDGGTTVINTANSLGAQAGSATINNAVLEVNGNITESSRGFTLGNAASTIQVDSGDTYTISGTIGGSGGTLNKTGAGTLVLGGSSNTYGNGTVVAAGLLKDGVLNALPAGTNLIMADNGSGSGATFDLNGNDQTVGSITTSGGGGSNTITDNAAAAILTVNTSAGDLYAGTLTGNMSLTKTGAGTLTLAGAGNTNTGLTTVNDGELALNVTSGSAIAGGNVTVSGGTLTNLAANQINDASVVMVDSGVWNLNGNSETVASLVSSQTTGTVTSTAGTPTLTVNTANIDTFAGQIAGSLSFTKTGSGTLIPHRQQYLQRQHDDQLRHFGHQQQRRQRLAGRRQCHR